MFFKIGGKHVFWSLFLIKLQPEDLQIYYKKTSAQVFSCEIFKISKRTFFYRTHSLDASVCFRTPVPRKKYL